MQNEVTVTQADRDAAAEFLPMADEACGECERGLMRFGEMDDHWLVQAFARHRHQAERETLARMEAEIKRLREALDEIRDLPGEINPCNYDHDDACELNRQFCYAITVADAALNLPAPEAGQ